MQLNAKLKGPVYFVHCFYIVFYQHEQALTLCKYACTIKILKCLGMLLAQLTPSYKTTVKQWSASLQYQLY